MRIISKLLISTGLKVQIIISMIYLLTILPILIKSDTAYAKVLIDNKSTLTTKTFKKVDKMQKIKNTIDETESFKVTPQNTIVNLNINNKLDYDYEIYINSDGSFSLPFKSISKLLEINAQQNKLTKEISFISPDGISGTIDYQKQKIIFGNKTINFTNNISKLVFLKNGLLEDIKDEIFVPVKILNDILNTNIVSDIPNYSVLVNTDRPLKSLVDYNKESETSLDPFGDYSNSDDTLSKIFIPEKTGVFSLNTIKFDNHSELSSNLQSGQNKNFKSSAFDNSSQMIMNGSLFNGTYQLRMSSINNKDKPFSFGGVSVKYDKEWKNYNLELGEISGVESNLCNIGNGILGFKFGNLKNIQDSIQSLDGMVKPGSKVNVFINNNLFSTLNTRGGYYNLRDVSNYDKKVYKLKLEEITLEGKATTIQEQDYPYSQKLMFKGRTGFDFLAGVTGYSNNFFGDSYSIDDYKAKKLVGGLNLSYGLTDKATLNVLTIGDYIAALPDKQALLNKLPFDKNISNLILGTFKDFNPIQGQTGLISFNYIPKDNLDVSADLGISHATSRVTSELYDIKPVGFSSVLSMNYKKPLYDLSSKLYNYSSNFYMAGSSGLNSEISTLNDKLGGSLSGNLKIKKALLNGNVNSYFTNLDKRVSGGRYKFNDYGLSAKLPLKGKSSLDFRHNARIGKNSWGEISNNSSEINYERGLTQSLALNLSGRINKFSTKYLDNEDNSYFSKFKIFTGRLSYNIPKELGEIDFTHDIVKTTSNTYKNNYNALRIGFIPRPIFGKIITSTALGYHYLGNNKGLDLSIVLGYKFNSGKKLEISYLYNRQQGSYLGDILIPTTSRHSISVNLSDVLSVMGGCLKSVNSARDDDGYIKVVTYLDANQNGVKDKDESIVPNIVVNLIGIKDTVFTNKQGEYVTKGLNSGLYKVNLDFGQLPGLLSISPSSQQEYLVKVDKKKQTKVYFGLISSIGNVSGKVNVVDEFNKQVDIKDLVVTVHNDKGEEIKYTTINSDGTYNIPGLSPGKYTLEIDKDFLEAYHLEPKTLSRTEIAIPAIYKDYVDINDINLEYTQIYKS